MQPGSITIQRTAERLLRPLDLVEAQFAYLHAIMHGTTQVVSQLLVDTIVAPQELLLAARSLFERFQILRTCIRENGGELWFAEHGNFSRIPFQITHARSLETVEQDMQEELARPLDSEKGLWRLRLVRIPVQECSVIILTRNHAISDGSSTKLIFRELVANLSTLRKGKLPSGISEPLASWPVARPGVQPPNGGVLAPALRFNSFAPVPSRTPRFLDLDITCQESERLLGFCKSNNVTVTQLLSALFMKSYCRVRGTDTTALFTAVSLRSERFHTELVQEMGCHITVVRTVPRNVTGDLLTLARQCGRLLETAIESWQPKFASHSALRSEIEALASSDRFGGIAITNTGSAAAKDFSGDIRPLGMRTIVNRIGANYAVVLHVLSFDGKLCLTFAYSEPAMPAKDVELMKAQFRALMETCGCAGDRPVHENAMDSSRQTIKWKEADGKGYRNNTARTRTPG